MEASKIPDFLQLCQNDLDLAIEALDKMIKKVSNGNNEIHKTKLLTKMLDFAKVLVQKPPLEKRTIDLPSEDSVPAKKIKLDSERKVELPNEIWLKIMSYLKTKDLLKNFNLVCKHFKSLTLDSSAMKYLDVVKDLYAKEDYQNVVKVIKRSKCLKSIGIYENHKYLTLLISHALKSNPNLKSIKLVKLAWNWNNFRSQNVTLSPTILNGIANSSVEKLELQHIKICPDLASSIGKMKSLKSLSVTSNNYFELNPTKLITELATNSKKLEEIELSNFKYDDGFVPFFEVSCQTLKKLRLNNVFHGPAKVHELSLCQNLSVISLKKCTFSFNSENFYLMPELSKVSIHESRITRDIHGKYFRQGSKLPNLKYLCLRDCFPTSWVEYERFFAELTTVYCPNLERISIYINNYGQCLVRITESLLKQLFQNCPKLKSLKLIGFQTSQLSRDFLLEVYETRNIYLDIWKYRRSEDLIEFEQHITNQNDKFCAKYFKLKMSNNWKCEICE